MQFQFPMNLQVGLYLIIKIALALCMIATLFRPPTDHSHFMQRSIFTLKDGSSHPGGNVSWDYSDHTELLRTQIRRVCPSLVTILFWDWGEEVWAFSVWTWHIWCNYRAFWMCTSEDLNSILLDTPWIGRPANTDLAQGGFSLHVTSRLECAREGLVHKKQIKHRYAGL